MRKYTPEKQLLTFWNKVNKNGSTPVLCPELGKCWEWTASCRGSMNYGTKFWNGKGIYAHRISWTIHYGDIPNNLKVLHKCDNPKCVNPEHLFLGTDKDNSDDMIAKGRKMADKVNRKGEHNPKAKISDVDANKIRMKYNSGIKQIVLAAEYGISVSGISFIVHKRKIILNP